MKVPETFTKVPENFQKCPDIVQERKKAHILFGDCLGEGGGSSRQGG